MTVLTDMRDRALSLLESSACSSRGDGSLVWSGLQSQRTDLGSLLDRHPYRVVGEDATEGGRIAGRHLMSVLFLTLTLFQHPVHFVFPRNSDWICLYV